MLFSWPQGIAPPLVLVGEVHAVTQPPAGSPQAQPLPLMRRHLLGMQRYAMWRWLI